MAIERDKVKEKVPTIAETEAKAIPEKVEPERIKGLDEVAKGIKEYLAKETKVPIFIPIDETNPSLNVYPVNLGGYVVQIPMGVQYKVPQSIYDIWYNSYQSQVAANGMIQKEIKVGDM